jgi:hypothetical protein
MEMIKALFWTGLGSPITGEISWLSSKLNIGAARQGLPLVNGHNISVYCNGLPSEWWALTAHHSFPTVFRQPLDVINGHQGPWPNIGGYINTPHSEESDTTLFSLKTSDSLSLLTWASEHLQVHNSPLIHRNGAEQSLNTGQRSTLITCTIEYLWTYFFITSKLMKQNTINA